MEIDKDVHKNGECFGDHNNSNTQQQPKKQSRRRLHNNKPYEERFLKMAQARKEIATALKFHRASMKQKETSTNNYNLQSPSTEHEWKSNSGMFLSTNHHGSYYFPAHWPMSTIIPPPPPPLLNHEDVNLVLPDQTLGLNLNFQDFNNLNTIIYHKPMPVYSPSTSSSAAVVKFPGLHQDMESDEMEEDRKAVNSHEEEDDGYDHPFEQVIDFPPWLNTSNDNSCFQHFYDHHFSHDPALPCMDIDEIEGIDGEWLA